MFYTRNYHTQSYNILMYNKDKENCFFSQHVTEFKAALIRRLNDF